MRGTMQKYWKELSPKANVVSLGLGRKEVRGERTEEAALVVGVSQKVPLGYLSKRDRIPPRVGNWVTDVVKVGEIRAQGEDFDPTQRHRPAPPGSSIGHPNVTAGTFGCVVQDEYGPCILSNNHILADSNEGRLGDPIYQPGPLDGGTEEDTLGHLLDFVPIHFSGQPGECPWAKLVAWGWNVLARVLGRQSRLSVIRERAQPNEVDAAVAAPMDSADLLEEIPKIGRPLGVVIPEVGMEIQKYGRTSQYTTGTIQQVGAIVTVSYGGGKSAVFEDQIMTTGMSQGGDSGSVVLDMENKLVGLLFAGSSSVTVLNPITRVFELLRVGL